ncbi:hypothetical protein [Streptomyces sp. NPDC006668]
MSKDALTGFGTSACEATTVSWAGLNVTVMFSGDTASRAAAAAPAKLP